MIDAMLLVVGLAALAMLWAGVRGRRVDDHLRCARCGYDLRGGERLACPECGADLRGFGNVREGSRQRRPTLAMLGAMVAAIALLPLAYRNVRAASLPMLDPYKPVAVLRWEAKWQSAQRAQLYFGTHQALPAIAELQARTSSGRLSPSQLDLVMDDVLTARATLPPGDDALKLWNDLAWDVLNVGGGTAKQRETFVRGAFGFRVLLPKRLRRDHSLKADVDIWGLCDTHQREFISIIEPIWLRVGATADAAPGHTGSLRHGGGRSAGLALFRDHHRPFDVLPLGRHDVKVETKLHVDLTPGGQRIGTVTLNHVGQIELVPDDAPLVTRVKDAVMAERVRSEAQNRGPKISFHEFGGAFLSVSLPDVQADQAWRACIGDGQPGRWGRVVKAEARPRHTRTYDLPVEDSMLDDDRVTVRLVPNEDDAAQTPGVATLLDHEIVLENVPVVRGRR